MKNYKNFKKLLFLIILTSILSAVCNKNQYIWKEHGNGDFFFAEHDDKLKMVI